MYNREPAMTKLNAQSMTPSKRNLSTVNPLKKGFRVEVSLRPSVVGAFWGKLFSTCIEAKNFPLPSAPPFMISLGTLR